MSKVDEHFNSESYDNLKRLTSEEAREYGRRGGKKSAESRRKRKALKEQLELFLSLPLQNEEAKELLTNLGVNVEDIDNQMAINLALCQKALKGDTKAYELIRDTIGEKPKEKISVENPQTTKVLESINKQLKKSK